MSVLTQTQSESAQLRKYNDAISEIIARNYANGTPANINKEVAALQRSYKNTFTLQRTRDYQQLQEARKQNEFVDKYTAPVEDELRDDLHKLIDKQMANITKKVLKMVQQNMKDNKPDFTERLKKVLKNADKYAATIERTASAMLSNQRNVHNAIKADPDNDPYLRYTGPTSGNIRTTCADYVGKVKRACEWRVLTNSFGQSLLAALGGWNCRHRFVHVPDYKN